MTQPKKKVALALQGGGAHGSFTWGVIDRLLEEDSLEITGISGTSAGGMIAASTIQGLIKGGNSMARATLKDYWQSISALPKKSFPFTMTPYNKQEKYYNLDYNPLYVFARMVISKFSPYEFNPQNYNPLFDFLKEFFDFPAIRDSKEKRLFLSATHVKSGRIKVFSNKDFCADVLLASACLPGLFQSVVVDGEYYWDGGFIANPAIYPLINECDGHDIIMVPLTRTYIDTIPKTRAEITDRLTEITCNGCLVREMRAIYYITKLIDEGKIKEGELKRINMHIIKNEDAFKGLNLSSTLNVEWDFLMMLFNEGRKTADRWVAEHYDKIGTPQDSVDERIFQDFVA